MTLVSLVLYTQQTFLQIKFQPVLPRSCHLHYILIDRKISWASLFLFVSFSLKWFLGPQGGKKNCTFLPRSKVRRSRCQVAGDCKLLAQKVDFLLWRLRKIQSLIVTSKVQRRLQQLSEGESALSQNSETTTDKTEENNSEQNSLF